MLHVAADDVFSNGSESPLLSIFNSPETLQVLIPVILLVIILPLLIWRLRVAHYNRYNLATHWSHTTFHPWVPFSYTPQPRYCSACRQLISGFLLFRNIGYECQICGIFSHISCIRGSDKLPCKTPSRQWPVQHQIREGNLQNNSVCTICGVVCSSSFSLFGLECLWCHRTFHGYCLEKALDFGHDTAMRCDLGPLVSIVLPPSAITVNNPAPKPLPLKSAMRASSAPPNPIIESRQNIPQSKHHRGRTPTRPHREGDAGYKTTRMRTLDDLHLRSAPTSPETNAKTTFWRSTVEQLRQGRNDRSQKLPMAEKPYRVPLTQETRVSTRDSRRWRLRGGTQPAESVLDELIELSRLAAAAVFHSPQEISGAGTWIDGHGSATAPVLPEVDPPETLAATSDVPPPLVPTPTALDRLSTSSHQMLTSTLSPSLGIPSNRSPALPMPILTTPELSPGVLGQTNRLSEPAMPSKSHTAMTELEGEVVKAGHLVVGEMTKAAETAKGIGMKLQSFAKSLGRGLSSQVPPTPALTPLEVEKKICSAVSKLHHSVSELLFELERFSASPIIAFINPKSGGQVGQTLLKEFYSLLNPWQVVNLSLNQEPRVVLRRFRALAITGRMRILVCGGDGTVSWIVDAVTEEYKNCPTFASLSSLNSHCRKWVSNLGDNKCTAPESRPLIRLVTAFDTESAQVPIAILPLGTGNDLARILHWGGSFDGGDLLSFLKKLVFAKPVPLDLWTIEAYQEETTPPPKRTFGRRSRPESVVTNPMSARGEPAPATQRRLLFRKTFTNYVDVGIAARIALKFHILRESHPELFRSRLGNKLVYGEVGVRDFLVDQPINLAETEVSCDGRKIDLSRFRREGNLEGLAVVNIPSFAGGCKVWRVNGVRSDSVLKSSRSDSFASATSSYSPLDQEQPTETKEAWQPQKYSDGIIELVAFKSLFHLGQVQVGVTDAVKVVQGRELNFFLKTPVPVQVDGEPQQLSPCELRIKWKSTAQMLKFHAPRLKSHHRSSPSMIGEGALPGRKMEIVAQPRLISQDRIAQILNQAVQADEVSLQQARSLAVRLGLPAAAARF